MIGDHFHEKNIVMSVQLQVSGNFVNYLYPMFLSKSPAFFDPSAGDKGMVQLIV
jgi:hypothetical protein